MRSRNLKLVCAVTGMLLGLSPVLAQTTTESTTDGVIVDPSPAPRLGVVVGGGLGIGNVRNEPYSLVEKTTTIRTLADGTTMTDLREERKMRDAQGRQRMETGHLQDGQFVADIIHLSDPAARTTTTLDVRTKTARVIRPLEPRQRTPEEEARLAERRGQAQSTPRVRTQPMERPVVEKLSMQNIAGVEAEGTRTTRVIPAGSEGNDREITVVTETWFARELMINMGMTVEDPRTGKTTAEVTQLERNEPDSRLFEIPSDYKVIDPKRDELGTP